MQGCRWLAVLAAWLCLCGLNSGWAQDANQGMSLGTEAMAELAGSPLVSPDRVGSVLQLWLAAAVLSLAPAILLMTTCFVRIVVVLGLLRQALGTPQMPSQQVITALAMFLTLLVMGPVWQDSYEQGVRPYANREIGWEDAWSRTVGPMRKFMSQQIERTHNRDSVWMFYDYAYPGQTDPASYDEVPLNVLLPAFLLSELKTAFLIGFQVYLPFVVLDLLVSSVLMSMGLLMLPPAMIRLPLKLLLFVLVDGWQLVVGMLLESFVPYN